MCDNILRNLRPVDTRTEQEKKEDQFKPIDDRMQQELELHGTAWNDKKSTAAKPGAIFKLSTDYNKKVKVANKIKNKYLKKKSVKEKNKIKFLQTG